MAPPVSTLKISECYNTTMQYDIDILSDHNQLFLTARDILLSYEGMQETKKPRITTYSIGGKGICHMRTMPHGIDFGFLKGAKMEDKFNALTGDGKAMRVLPVSTVIDEATVRYYLDQAVALVSDK